MKFHSLIIILAVIFGLETQVVFSKVSLIECGREEREAKQKVNDEAEKVYEQLKTETDNAIAELKDLKSTNPKPDEIEKELETLKLQAVTTLTLIQTLSHVVEASQEKLENGKFLEEEKNEAETKLEALKKDIGNLPSIETLKEENRKALDNLKTIIEENVKMEQNKVDAAIEINRAELLMEHTNLVNQKQQEYKQKDEAQEIRLQKITQNVDNLRNQNNDLQRQLSSCRRG